MDRSEIRGHIPTYLRGTLRAIYGLLAVLAALGLSGGAASAFVVSQTSPVITSKCGSDKQTAGCTWCVEKSGNCYVVSKSADGKCTVVKLPPMTTKGNGKGKTANPVKTTTSGDKAPVTGNTNLGRKVPVDVVKNGGP